MLTVVLSVFLGYNVYLAARNVTTNESFKRDALRDAVAATKAAGETSDVDWDEVMRNQYDRGVWANLMEVVRPPVSADRPWRVPCATTSPSSTAKAKTH